VSHRLVATAAHGVQHLFHGFRDPLGVATVIGSRRLEMVDLLAKSGVDVRH
jgi:hypothetical protein